MKNKNETIKMVLIGAGSKSFSRAIINDLILDEELSAKFNMNIVLVDLDEEKLKETVEHARHLAEQRQSGISFSATTNRKEALKDAQFIFTSVAVKRMELWEQDFRIASSFGIKHVLGENGGPAAVFHTLRNLELLMPVCRDIEAICPDAYLFNFTNPEARILTAILKLTKVKAVGLCHGFHSLRNTVAKVLEMPADRLDIRSAGMNHLFTYYKISDKTNGEDLRGKFEKRLSSDPNVLLPLTRFFYEKFGILGMNSDDHIGEYIPYAEEFTSARWHYGTECRKIPRHNDSNESIKENKGNTVPVKSGELAVPIIGDILLNRNKWRNAVNILNREGYIANLAKDACIEVPATVNAEGIHPEFVGDLPEAFAAQIRLQNSIQKLLIDAYASGSKKLLLQALLLDPLVQSATEAEKYLDYMLDIQAEYLPEFK